MKLINKFGKDNTEEKLISFNDALMSKGYKYKSHYHTILTWDRNDKKKNNKTLSQEDIKKKEMANAPHIYA